MMVGISVRRRAARRSVWSTGMRRTEWDGFIQRCIEQETRLCDTVFVLGCSGICLSGMFDLIGWQRCGRWMFGGQGVGTV